jgi:hypothetical protein
MAFLPGSDPSHFDESTLESVFLVAGHVFLLLPAASSLYRRHFYLAILAISVILFSGQFHMCQAQWLCFAYGPISDLEVLKTSRLGDHVVSTNAAMGTLLTMLTTDPGGKLSIVALRLILLLGIFYVTVSFPFSVMANFLSVVCLVIVMAAHVFLVLAGRLPPPDRFLRIPLFLCLFFAGTGYALFTITVIPYGIAHSLWHVCISLALYFAGEATHHNRGMAGWIDWDRCCSWNSVRDDDIAVV